MAQRLPAGAQRLYALCFFMCKGTCRGLAAVADTGVRSMSLVPLVQGVPELLTELKRLQGLAVSVDALKVSSQPLRMRGPPQGTHAEHWCRRSGVSEVLHFCMLACTFY